MTDNEIRSVVSAVLQGDTELLQLLSPNNPQWNETDYTGELKAKYSILPADKFDHERTKLPALTLQMGETVSLGTYFYETRFYIRCYNSSIGSYVNITKILDRVVKLLNRKNLKINQSQFIELKLETLSGEMEDQAYNLPFREARFTIQRV